MQYVIHWFRMLCRLFSFMKVEIVGFSWQNTKSEIENAVLPMA